ncbi:MAG: phosphonate metabolism transcriptional regulator PhnF [Acetobacteraceae bacterium]|nr:phosphonate metabolism transcriptional regulator PhnF [Acetobacteraceae bacterium]
MKPPAVREDETPRQAGLALWRQIAETLRLEIGGSDYPPGARLPTEGTLTARFGVNRHTVRRALEELSRSGLIRVEQGRGTFVAEDVLDYTVGPRTRFTEWIRRHDKEPSGRVLQLREIAADAAVASGLGIRPGTRVVMLERLGLADDTPVSLTRHYFPASRLRGILNALDGTPRITEALKAVGVDDYVRLVTRVSARAPTPSEAALLRMARNRPVLITESTNAGTNGPWAGVVVEFGVGCYPTPRVQIVFEPGEGPP